MKKKIYMIIVALALILIITICLVACENTGTSRDFNIEGTNLICIGTSSTAFINLCVLYYDKSTKVMYMYIKYGYGAGLTPLYNADGTLRLYEGE